MSPDYELPPDLAEIFLNTAPDMLDDVRRAVARRDPEAINAAAHALKGAVCYFDDEEAHDAALGLERLGRERRLDDVEGAWTRLEAATTALIDRLGSGDEEREVAPPPPPRASTPGRSAAVDESPWVLIVDDVEVERAGVAEKVRRLLGMEAFAVGSVAEAIKVLVRRRPALVLADLQMPGSDGMALIDAFHRWYPLVPVVLMTSHGSEDVVAEALRAGAAGYLPKQRMERELATAVGTVLKATKDGTGPHRLGPALRRAHWQFELGPDPSKIPDFVHWLRGTLMMFRAAESPAATRASMAVAEVLRRASTARAGDRPDGAAFRFLVDVRIEPDAFGFEFADLGDPGGPSPLDECADDAAFLGSLVDEVGFGAGERRLSLRCRRGVGGGPPA